MGEWGPASLIFDNVRVPEENILGEIYGGYNLGLEWIGFARWIVGALVTDGYYLFPGA
jgi:acyl-CoA dehydrogenase